MSFTTIEAVASALENKTIDFVVVDEFSANALIDTWRLERVKVLQYTTDFCMYFTKASKLKDEFNEAIFNFIENGEIEKIKNSYKNDEKYNLPLKSIDENAPVLYVGLDLVGEPYSDISEDGFVYGIDIDIATLLANSLGYNIEFIVTDFEKLYPMLTSNEVDIVISGMVYDEIRAGEFDCSFSYLSENYELLKRK